MVGVSKDRENRECPFKAFPVSECFEPARGDSGRRLPAVIRSFDHFTGRNVDIVSNYGATDRAKAHIEQVESAESSIVFSRFVQKMSRLLKTGRCRNIYIYHPKDDVISASIQ